MASFVLCGDESVASAAMLDAWQQDWFPAARCNTIEAVGAMNGGDLDPAPPRALVVVEVILRLVVMILMPAVGTNRVAKDRAFKVFKTRC